MAMTVLNNSAAIMTLGELNRNITKVGKSLSRLSTGQKINSAQDNASEYSISERMRAKIRALDQDVQNVQNGSSMLKTALGGIQDIVSELRELKQLAIDAANDSNTDDDRRIMQKVLKQKQENIDNIASSTSFNTKTLLDGTYQAPHWKKTYGLEFINDGGFNGSEIDPTTTRIKAMTLHKITKRDIIGDLGDLRLTDVADKDLNIVVLEQLNTVRGLASAFEAMHNGITFGDGTRSVETRDAALYAQRPKDIGPDSVVPDRNFIRSSGGAPLAVRLDFSGARDSEGHAVFGSDGSVNLAALYDQGFSILASDSSHFVNIKFASGSGAEFNNINGIMDDRSNDGNTNATGDIEYTIGIDEFAGNENFEQTAFGFAQYIFDKLKGCEDRKDIFGKVLKHGGGLDTVEDNDYNITLSQHFNLRMSKDNEGNVYLTKYEPYTHNLGILDDGILQTKYLQVFDAFYTVGEQRKYDEYVGNPLWIQHGTEAGQHMNIYINSMYNKALGTDAADVSTKDRALASIDYIDVAIEYALDQATTVGAYLERMDYTEANVNSENENTQAAESVIRDADMARETVNYAKHNILFQASQSMLAQANRSWSSVLGLLQ